MQLTMKVCRKRLAVVWFLGAGLLFVVFILQTVSGHYGNKASEAWGWLLPTLLPTLSLITGVFATDVFSKTIEIKTVDEFLYKLTLSLSITYLLAVGFTVFVSPLTTTVWTPLELMKLSNLWLAPLQGTVGTTTGVFFVKDSQHT